MAEQPPITVVDHALEAGVARVLTLGHGDRRSPIDARMASALRARLAEADASESVRVVVVTGEGPAFSAGGDLRGYLALYRDEAAFRAFLDDFEAACHLLERGRFASIARVNGDCVAGGLELMLACDVAIAATTARIGDGHLKFGQLPGAGGSQRLCRTIGLQPARWLLLTGRLVDGREAQAMGLVTSTAAPEDLEAQTLALAAEIARHSPLAVERMKSLIALSQDELRPVGLAAEIEVVARYATTSHDATEGLHAFLERRPPRWSGR
ncbi:MAG: enoyl-CoA hydratase/isomerase family protein [Myxococcota bacterium]